MGEAKRRRLAANRIIEYRDATTGETVTLRAAGDPREFHDRMVDRGNRLLRGDPRAVDAAVPCNGCRECCYHAGVDVHPEDEPPENLAHLQTERREDGVLYLRKREDGACVHLGAKGCTVYEHRPRACRGYDCRVYALTNVLDTFDGAHQQPRWLFEPKNPESGAFLAACHMTGMLKLSQLSEKGEDCSANDVAQAVFSDQVGIRMAAEAFLELGRLSPDQLTKALGFDPSTLTAEQMRQGLNTLSGGRAEVMALVPVKDHEP